MNSLEAVIWCPACRVAKYEVHRVKAENEGVYENVSVPPNRSEKKCLVCTTNLERKP